ncbi:MAG: InlB B-repeat-containing protein [Acholeplasma sp.]|nr:InlB B-repeat-containing protein [Acholeplasma sp.]
MKKIIIALSLILFGVLLTRFIIKEKTITMYNVTFDSLSGTSVLSQVVNGNEYAIEPKEPEKSGYDFIIWQDKDGNDWIFNTNKITEDITLTAVWQIRDKTILETLDEVLSFDFVYSYQFGDNIERINEKFIMNYSNSEFVNRKMDNDLIHVFNALGMIERTGIHKIVFSGTIYTFDSSTSTFQDADSNDLSSDVIGYLVNNNKVVNDAFKIVLINGNETVSISFSVNVLKSLQEVIDETYQNSFQGQKSRNNNEISLFYTKAEYLNQDLNNDIVHFVSLLGSVKNTPVTEIEFLSNNYIWNNNKWQNDGNILTDDIMNYLLVNNKPINLDIPLVIKEGSISLTVTIKFSIAKTLQSTLDDVLGYTYGDYTYVGNMIQSDDTLFESSYTLAQYSSGDALRDMARFLGAIKYVDPTTVNEIIYQDISYIWDEETGLKGSNWVDVDGVTLVSVITSVLLPQGVAPEPIVLVISDGIELLSFSLELIVS